MARKSRAVVPDVNTFIASAIRSRGKPHPGDVRHGNLTFHSHWKGLDNKGPKLKGPKLKGAHPLHDATGKIHAATGAHLVPKAGHVPHSSITHAKPFKMTRAHRSKVI